MGGDESLYSFYLNEPKNAETKIEPETDKAKQFRKEMRTYQQRFSARWELLGKGRHRTSAHAKAGPASWACSLWHSTGH